jgi:hypothetical protein
MRADFLYDVLKDAGLDVIAVQGWKTRGGELASIDAVLWHHDAIKGTGDMPSLSLLVGGRRTPTPVPGPLCQLALGRSGKWYVIAAGKANHAGPGSWGPVERSNRTIGIEAANDGIGEPWPDAQVDSYVEGTAAILKHLGLTANAMCGHKEWATPRGRKIDPWNLNMTEMRQRVQWAMNIEGDDDMTPEQAAELDAIGKMVRTDHHVLTVDGARLWQIEDKLNKVLAMLDQPDPVPES